MSFWSSIFGGASPTLTSDINKTGQISGFASGLGQQNATAGSNFFSSILSGDATKTSQALAPQISAAKKSLQQDQKTNAMNGTRSGGTAASNNAAQDKIHSDITNLTGSLTGGAASSLLSSGSSLLGTALSGYGQQSQMSQEQMQNWQNSIFGKAIGQGVGAVTTGAVGGLGTEVSTLGNGNFGW